MLGKTLSSYRLLAVAVLGAFLFVVPVLAEDNEPLSLVPVADQQEEQTPPQEKASAVVVRVGQHEAYDRIVFDWPRATPYKVSRTGNHVTVQFSSSATVGLKPTALLTRARNFSAGIDASGHLLISFNVADHAAIKDFFSGNSIAVDVQGPAPNASTEAPPSVVAEKTKPKIPDSSLKAETPPEKPVAKPSDTLPAMAAAPPETTETPPEAIKLPDLTSETSMPTAATKTPRDIPIIGLATNPVLVASLDAHTPLRAAVWSRAGFAYIVFDKKLALSAEALERGLPAPLVNLAPLELPKNSGFCFTLPDEVEVHAALDQTTWKLFLTKVQPAFPVSASLVPQPNFALGARFLLPSPDSPEPIHLTDQVVGDDLWIVPLTQAVSFSVGRRMADFQILPAAQGLVIKPWSDALIVRPVSDGIEITSESGLHLSPSSLTKSSPSSEQKNKADEAEKSLFNIGEWRGNPGETFTQGRQRLQQTIADVPESERDRARLELARFYFARGYGMEASALLNYLTKNVPDLVRNGDFLAVLGAARIMADHPDEGLKDLQAANLPDQPDIKLWQAVADAKIGNWVDADAKFSSTKSLLSSYPEPFYSRFYILAAESALAVGHDVQATDWINTLETSGHDPRVDPAIHYLHGVLFARAGQAQAATAEWKLAAESKDALYQVRAELALIDLDVVKQSLSPAQAADRLEALRFAWRGDDLEADILQRLGQFYIKDKNVKAGLAVLDQSVHLYPYSSTTPKTHDLLVNIFHDVFLGDIGKNLTPLESLAIYQQYRGSLMPTNDDSVVIMRNLAERLVAIDLMDQAEDLLEDVAKNKIKGEERAHVTSRLAALRLLDHKPQAALDALELSAADTLPEPIQKERLLLRAKALSQLHREDEALNLLKDMQDYPARLLRADINLSGQHWDDAAKNLLTLVGPPPKAGEALKPEQADWLLRSAIALAMANNQTGLDRLAIDYGAAMAGTPQNSMFHILTEADNPGQLKDVAAVQKQIADVDMFQSFLNSYRKPDDLSAAPATVEKK